MTVAMVEKPNNLGLPHFKSTVDNSLTWRLWHGINYMIGGITFVLGSIVYHPAINAKVNGDVLGGWLFTVGSAAFLLADLTEWNHFKMGCVTSTDDEGEISNTFYAKFRRVEFGLNFFGSTIGSLLYLLGSIFFIPATNMLELGETLFIWGSLIIFFSQAWKCYRASYTNELDDNDKSVRCSNINADFPGFMVDLWAGLGGGFYAYGTHVFSYIKTDWDLLLSVYLFIMGGTSFFLSGVFMQYRYFCKEYKRESFVLKETEVSTI